MTIAIVRQSSFTVRTFVVLFILAAVAIAAAGSVLVYSGRIQLNSPDPSVYSARGIDVSSHQGLIQWPRVAKQGIEFVYIKATEGGDFQDSRFLENWDGAGTVGITRGAYHFFTLCKSGKEQAANFVSIVPVTPVMLPPAIDLEYGGNCGNRPGPEELRKELNDFADVIAAHYKRNPILYTTYEFHDDYFEKSNLRYSFWIRSIIREPARSDQTFPWIVWQYSSRGRVSGIKGFTDMNAFFGSREAFKRFSESTMVR